jgi:hypothetical protein
MDEGGREEDDQGESCDGSYDEEVEEGVIVVEHEIEGQVEGQVG